MTATNTRGVQLTEKQWNSIEKACTTAEKLEEVKQKGRPFSLLSGSLLTVQTRYLAMSAQG